MSTTAVTVALLVPGCGGGQEYLVLERFFASSHLRDRTALARFATTIFEPRIDGYVDRFRVVDVGPDVKVSTEGEPDASANRVAQLSLDDPLDPVDLKRDRPSLVERTVTIEAGVRRPDGTKATRRIQLTLVRASVNQHPARTGRWIVTAFR